MCTSCRSLRGGFDGWGVRNVKIRVNFKDGLTVTTEDVTNSQFYGNGNFLELVRTGIKNNSTITCNDDKGNIVERTYNDVRSFEVVVGE